MTNLFRKLKSKLPFSQEPNKLEIHDDDKFLVSYPKSGNTWIRFIIGNLLKEEGESIDFHSAINYVPEIGTHDDVINEMLPPRIMKSHSLYQEAFNNVIYIVRDPRDVYVSYFHYLKKRLPENMTFSQFLRKSDIYPSRWHIHVESWLGKPNVSSVIKYEDLLIDPFHEVQKMSHLLFGDKIEDEKIKAAIDASSFGNMKKLEVEKGRPFVNKEAESKATTFVREGKQGDWRNYFSEEDEAFLLAEVGDLMKYFGYI
jgi:hypothetical protein